MSENPFVRPDDVDDVRSPRWAEAVAASLTPGALVPAGGDGEADDEPLAGGDVDGNLWRYARWQWRDFWRTRGLWTAVGALLGLWLMTYLASHAGRSDVVGSFQRGPMRPENISSMAHVFFTLGGALAAVLGIGGLVSRERERGLQRFLFAKPVRPLRYYLQLFGVNTLGSLLVLTGAVLLAGLLIGSAVPIGTVLAVAVGAYLLTAGVTFFVSTLVRFDAPIAAAWLMAGFPVVVAAENGLPGARALSWLFPQGPAVAAAKAIEAGRPGAITLAGAVVILIAILYGLVAFAGGMVVLRRRPVST